MENVREKFESLKSVLLGSTKEKLILVSTTADITNPEIIFGSTRETKTTIAVTIILREKSSIDEIVSIFDGVVGYFLIDCEVKNEAGSLAQEFLTRIKKSKCLIVKPNDFTVDSLDIFIVTMFGSVDGKKIFIIGAGNLGSKISLKLCERGAGVFLFDKDIEKSQKIIEGLNLIKRSGSSIALVKTLADGAKDTDLIIGCTPGISVIDSSIVDAMKAGGKIIDAGNRNIFPEAIAAARARSVEVLSLSSLGGYIGMIENWLYQRRLLEKPRSRYLNGASLITPGTLGARGDILVDDVENPKRVFGICDGIGGLMPKEEGLPMLKQFVANNQGTGIISGIEELYQ